ncbi:MAG: DUF4006 family protein [Sulfurimonas sp.]|nr:DUF4006 family protein [Sulfurimonas sp.]
MNENRGIFTLSGISGMLIATALLLSLLVVFTVWGLNVQNANMNNYYEVVNKKDIKSGIGGNGSKQSDHIVDVK